MREKLQALKPWLWPLLALVVALLAGSILVGKMRREVWAYYTDGKGLKTDALDEKARPVLWQDPEPQYFEEKDRQAPGDSLEAAFSADGTTMVLVRRSQSADLYVSDWDGRKWSAPRPLDAVNTDANERSPALSSDGRSLYFASDRKDGAGGYDLYVAELENDKWKPAQALPKEINTPANELGPALSADGEKLYFSSDRDGRGDDIFVAKFTDGKFGAAEPVAGLNSQASDVRTALTARGDHVFLASDRDRDKKSGFKVYISRVVEGRAQPPEEVDLHIERGNVLDPAARMDGFDLLFSVGETEKSGYRLYRSTTREVVGYTDLTRWEDFKSLLRNIAWWLLLALAALAALIYILEKWRDMTTLYHKCLAGSAVLHLIALLIAMLWLIARKVEDQDLGAAEVSISVDALAEEELAMESVPEETELTDTPTQLESEKVEAEFGAPGFQEQQEAQPVMEAAHTLKEADLVEVRAANAESPQEPVPQPEVARESSLLNDLDATKLPSVDDPVLEEAQPEKPVAAADRGKDAFEPEMIPATSTVKSETAEIADTAVKTEADATQMTEVNEPTPPADAPKESAVEVSATEAPSEAPDEAPPLESEMLSDLEAAQPVDSAEVALDEGAPAAAPSADTAADEFSPDTSATGLSSEQARGEAAADSAKQDAADAGTVASGGAPGESMLEAEAAEAAAEAPSGQPALESELLSDLGGAPPVNPAEGALDEGSTAAAPAETAADEFRPDASATGLSNEQARGEATADSAKQDTADAGAVASGGAPGESMLEAAPTESAAEAPSGQPSLESELLSDLGGAPPVNPAEVALDEGAPAAAPADPAADEFRPDASATGLGSEQARGQAAADSAKQDTADAGAVASGGAPGESMLEAAATEAAAEAPSGRPSLESELLSDLGGAPPVNPAEVSLDEGAPAAAAARADTAADEFRPDASATGLNSKQARGEVTADSAMRDATDAAAVPAGDAGEQVSALKAITANSGEPAASEERLPTAQLDPGSLSGLPKLVPDDPGTPLLEELGQAAGIAAANPSKDIFTPGNAVPNLATTPAGHRPLASTEPVENGGAASISPSPSERIGAAISTPSQLEASASLPKLDADGISPDLPVSTPVAALLPGQLEVDREGDPQAIAVALQKQRGKPGIDAIKQMGGSDGTEKSINSALEWLARNQEQAGHWDSRKHGASMNYNNGAAGLGLLCFYGWGERHDQACKYQDNVRRALDWLLAKQRKDGYLGEGPGMMYSHAIATIALCEGYGLTKDPRLREPSARAIAYTLAAQSKRRGGWRYAPGEDSDTSVTGWQYMALHSARMAGLQVPQDSFDRARGFLDQMGGGKHGGLYGYQERGKLSRAMVATGMFCRQLDLVPPSHPMMQESARLLKMYPMEAKDPDLYYVYYATLALYQHQGPIWEQWNERMKEILPQIQTKDGSWNPSSSMTAAGGRVISTALATLSLEVYYRLLPMYGFRNEEEPAPEPKKREK